MDHGKKKMMMGGKMKVKKMPGGGMMKKPMMMKHGGKHKMPMYMYGGKTFKDGGSLMSALMKDPKQRARAKKMLGM